MKLPRPANRPAASPFFPPQVVLSQPQTVLSQPQSLFSQPQTVLSQPQIVLSQPQTALSQMMVKFFPKGQVPNSRLILSPPLVMSNPWMLQDSPSSNQSLRLTPPDLLHWSKNFRNREMRQTKQTHNQKNREISPHTFIEHPETPFPFLSHTLSSWPNLHLARPSIPKQTHTTHTEFGRPGLPALTDLITRHPQPLDLTRAILSFSHAPQYKTKAGALYKDLITTTPTHFTWDERIILWAAKRLRTASALVVSNYISMVSTIATAEHGVDLKESHLIRGFVKAIKRLSGDHRYKPTTPVTHSEITQMIRSLPTPHNAIVLVAWKRAGRVRDVLETRVGGLWLAPKTQLDAGNEMIVVMLEEPFDKVSWAGLKDHTPLLIEHTLFPIISPFVTNKPPDTPPRLRPLIWPQMTTEKITRALQTTHPHLSSRSIRRGALQTLIQNGFTLDNCRLLSHHHTLDGLMKYLETTDTHTFATLVKMQQCL